MKLPIRVAVITVAFPVTVVVIGIALQLAWLPELPETVAIHMSLKGWADGYGPAWSLPVLLAVLGLGLPAIFGAILANSVTAGGLTATQKLIAAASVFAATLLAITVTGSVAVQREPAISEPPVAAMVVVGALISLGLAAAAWFALGATISSNSTVAAVDAVPVSPGERVIWVGRATLAAPFIGVLLATSVLATGVVAFAIATSGVWLLGVVPIMLAVVLLGTSWWNVRVDERGLSIRSALGWPRYRVALADFESAGITTVVPLGEFGGYGVRWGRGHRFGIITRGGEALEVQRRDGRAVVVTVDDAATAAGLLTALAARHANG